MVVLLNNLFKAPKLEALSSVSSDSSPPFKNIFAILHFPSLLINVREKEIASARSAS